METKYKETSSCLCCNSKDLVETFRIESLPLADRLNTRCSVVSEEIPLTLLICNDCGLVFIKELVNPDILFPQNYPYFTGVSEALRNHFKKQAELVIAMNRLDGDSLVIDIGSNDGTALFYFAAKGIKILGVDPTTRPALKAILNGIPTLRAFWNNETAKIVAEETVRKADVVLCNNVISHVDNPSEFINALNNICDNETTIIAEFPYLKSIVEKSAFDIIFHQHVSYFTITSFERLIHKHGFYANDAEIMAVHGGNLRVFFSKNTSRSARLQEIKIAEEINNLGTKETLLKFSKQIDCLKWNTLNLLKALKSKGQKIMGYGAAGKATTFVKHFELDKSIISGIIDKNEFKQNKYFPAYNHKIHSLEILSDECNKPDYLLILAWTLKEEIVSELSAFHKAGGKFIVVLPDLEII